MASNNYTQSVKNWTRIASEARASGIPDSTWRQLATRDIQGVLQGRTPMPLQEAVDSVRAAHQGSSVINKAPDTGGLFEELGNALHDVASLPVTFVQGSIDYAKTLPQQFQDYAKLLTADPATQQKYGLEDISGNPLEMLGSALRDAAKVPVFSAWIPGLHTAANLTTPAGREEIAQHPGYAALDVGTAAAAAGRAGLFGEAPADETFTAREALQRGKPFKAITRAVGDVTPGVDRAGIRQWMDNNAISSRITNNVAKPIQSINRAMQHTMEKFSLGKGEVSIGGDKYDVSFMRDFNKLDKPTKSLLTDIAAHHGDPQYMAELSKLPTSTQDTYFRGRDFTDALKEKGYARHLAGERGLIRTYINGQEFAFSDQSEVGQGWERTQRASDRLARAQSVAEDSAKQVERRKAALAGKAGKVRRWGETTADFAKRQAGPVGLDEIHASSQNLIDSFVNLDIKQQFQIPSGYGQLTRDIKALSGDTGLFSKLDDALKSGDAKTTRATLTKINRIFKHDSWGHTSKGPVLRDYISHLRDEATDIYARTRSHATAARWLRTAERDHALKLDRVNHLTTDANGKFAQLLTDIKRHPAATYHPLIDEQIRQGSIQLAHKLFNGDELKSALQRIGEGANFDQMKLVFAGHEEQFQAIYNDAVHGWTDLINKGYSPMWMQNIPSQKLAMVSHPSIMTDPKYLVPAQFHDSTFNMGRSMYDIVASLNSAASNLLREQGMQMLIDDHLMPLTTTHGAIFDQYLKIARGEVDSLAARGTSVDGYAQDLLKKEWVKFDPSGGWHQAISHFIKGNTDDLYLPRGVDKAMSLMMRDKKIPVVGEQSFPMKVFKYAVLTGPRHLAHVMLGGGMFMSLDDPLAWRMLAKGHSMFKSGAFDPTMENVGRTPMQDFAFFDDHALYDIQKGKTLGRMAEKVFGAPGRALNTLEEHVTNTYKIAATLSGEAKGMSREEAVAAAARMFVDMDNLSPFERAYMKSIMPFYAFTKHLFSYLLRYPSDHPYRLAALNNFARQAQEEWNTGLPQNMMNLFMLGSPDAKGNVTTIDYRSVNPFRSLYSDFTLAGVLSQLNPAFTMPFQLAGVNILSATPDLYPQLQWDPQTGQFTAVHDVTSGIYETANAFIPEFGAVDHFVGLTDRTRSLAKNNPEAFHRQLWGSLNLPLDIEKYNIPYEIARNESRRYKVAQSDVSGALAGDWGRLNGYNLVPVPSYLQKAVGGTTATPERLQAVWSVLTAKTPANVSPRALISRSRR